MAVPVSTPRRLRALAVASCAAVVLPVVAATPASAQTSTTTTSRSAATLGSVVRLTINLPQGNTIQLDLSTVSGTVTSVTGQGPQAEALATLLSGSVAGNAQSFPGAAAKLPSPKSATGPTNALSEGVAGTPLSDFLSVGVGTATADVTEAPNSSSTAQIANLGLGLPTQLADALRPVLDQVLAGLNTLIAALGPLDAVTTAFCNGVQPVVIPIADGATSIPVLGPIINDVVDGTVNPQAGVLCNLRAFVAATKAELDEALTSLAGPGGVIGTGLLRSEQTITTEGAKTTARSTATVADLELLGESPFGAVTALTTTSTAIMDGNDAQANVQRTAVQALAEPLLDIETDHNTITGDLAGINITGLNAVLTQLQTVLDGLAGIGISAGPLDATTPQLASCPETLTGLLSGTVEQDGVCAAAASAGYGIALTAPAQLTGPLGIAGPLLSVQFVPTAAVVRASSTTTTTQPPTRTPTQTSLPRTGNEAALGLAGLVLLAGAAAVRRRRATV